MMMGFGFIGMFLFGGVLLALLAGSGALTFFQTTGRQRSDGYEQPTVRQILDERLAQGEISREEYDLIRARIE